MFRSGIMTHFSSDVDLDFGDRNKILSCIDYTPASLENGERHNSGIYVTIIPQNIITGTASINYKVAEELGYVKLDILNNHLYSLVKNSEHLDELLARPIHWEKLLDKNFVSKLIHIGNYAEIIQRLPEPINSIEKLSMFLSCIRPGKKHLLGKPWSEVEKTVWDRDADGYMFKRSHGLAYSILVGLNIRLLEEQEL